MTTARLILAFAILLLAAYIIVMNWACVIVSMRNKWRGIGRHHSTVPVISCVLTACAYLIFPLLDRAWMIFVPLLDIATWSLLLLPVMFIREAFKNGSPPS